MENEQAVPAEVAEVEEPKVEETPVEAKAEDAPVEETPVPKKKSAQERIDEITKARREAEREREYWKQVALDKAKAEPKPVEQPARLPRPVISQFDTTEAYEDALLDWRDRVKEEQVSQQRMVAEQEEGLAKFQRAAAKAREQYPDFDEVVETPVFSPQMRYAILNSDTGPELAYFLGSPENRDTALKIQSLSPDKQYYEMGKLETRLALAQKTKKVPSAPPPINPVGMSGTGGEVDPSKMTTDEWMRWEKEKTLSKLKQKYSGG